MPAARRVGHLAAAIVAGLSLISVAGCASKPLRVGVSYDRPGLSLRVLHEFSGFESVLARDLATRLGHPGKRDRTLVNVPERRAYPSPGPLPYDVLIAAYPVQDSTRRAAGLVGPYLHGAQDLAVRASETGVVTAGSLAGRTVCAVAGSQIGADAPAMFPGAAIAYRPTLSTCLSELRAGSVDAVTDERLALRGYAAEAPYKGSIKVEGLTLRPFDYYVVVNPADEGLCRRVKDVLAKQIADGTWATAYREQLVRTGVAQSVPKPPTQIDGCRA